MSAESAAIIGAILGGVVSAWLTHLLSSNTKRRDLALDFVKEFLGLQQDYSELLHYLEQSERLRSESDEAKVAYNRIVNMGDKLEVFALCYVSNNLDRQIAINSGLRGFSKDFVEKVSVAIPALEPNQKHWRSLRDMMNMR